MIRYSEAHDVDLEQLAGLFVSAGWNERARDRTKLAALVANSRFVVSAWDGGRLVGFARAISDGVSNAYVSTVAVLPPYVGAASDARSCDGWSPEKARRPSAGCCM